MNTIRLRNGYCVSMEIAEVVSVPYFELLDKDRDRANHINQVLFSQIISSFHRKAEGSEAALELFFQSTAVSDQTYDAQVRMYVIVRRLDRSAENNESVTSGIMAGIKREMESKNYSLVILNGNDFDSFIENLKSVNTGKVLSVSKKEKVYSTPLSVNGYVYYTDAVSPSDGENISILTNALTNHPGSAVSLQIIPTTYTQMERYCIEEGRLGLNRLAGEMRFRHGMRPDLGTQMAVSAYDYYSAAANQYLYLCNFLVYSDGNSAAELANKLMDIIEDSDKSIGSALDVTDVSDKELSAKDIFSSPWTISDVLLYKARAESFWNSKTAPTNLVRMKQLMTDTEVRAVFKFPIDDGKTIGLDVKKVLDNREKLDKSILSEGSFKLGIIRNASKNAGGAAASAGIPLNDFTKHGLIVGTPGSGKTMFSLGLLRQFWNDFNIPFLAIEPTKTEYRSLVDSVEGLQVFTPGKNTVSPYIINPFLPPRGVTVETYVPSLMAAFKAAFSMPSPLPDIFQAAINECYNEYGWKIDSTLDDPGVQRFGLYEFIRIFKKKVSTYDYKGETRANMESAGVVRLVSLIEQNSNIYDNINSIPLEDLLSKPTVVELNAISNNEQKSLIMALLLIAICVHTKNNVAGDGKLKNILLIDEAHVLLDSKGARHDDSPDAQGATVTSIEDMIAEIRSYGTGIIIADQSPSRVGRNIIANTNVKVVFKLVEKENKDSISEATGMNASDYELMGRLEPREAMLHYGRIHNPLHIKAFSITDIRPVVNDAEIAERQNYWKTHAELLIPHNECRYNCECRGSCDFRLRADADFVATRLINRLLYKVAERGEFIKLLANLDKHIDKILKENPGIEPGRRMTNCIKIKFVRKAMLVKSFGLTESDCRQLFTKTSFISRD